MSEEEKTSDVQNVSSENLDQFMTERLNLSTVEAEEAEIVEEVEAGEKEEQSEEIEAKTKEPEVKEPEKKRNKLEQRMHDLVTQKKEAEEKARLLEEKLQQYEKPTQEEQKAQERPSPDQFEDIEAYTEALADWKADQKAKVDAQQSAAIAAQKAAELEVETWQARQKVVEEEFPDYKEVVASCDIQVAKEVQTAIIKSDLGPQILYHLASNPEEAQKVAAMDKIDAVRYIGRLEARFDKEEAKVKEVPTPPVKASKAPTPISPIKGASSIDAKVDANGEFTGNYEEYKAARLAGKIK